MYAENMACKVEVGKILKAETIDNGDTIILVLDIYHPFCTVLYLQDSFRSGEIVNNRYVPYLTEVYDEI